MFIGQLTIYVAYGTQVLEFLRFKTESLAKRKLGQLLKGLSIFPIFLITALCLLHGPHGQQGSSKYLIFLQNFPYLKTFNLNIYFYLFIVKLWRQVAKPMRKGSINNTRRCQRMSYPKNRILFHPANWCKLESKYFTQILGVFQNFLQHLIQVLRNTTQKKIIMVFLKKHSLLSFDISTTVFMYSSSV